MNELPVGRRMAHWRVRRNMTQQQFADRIGKSKSWVDKVERGVRRLERVSSLREAAEALRIDLEPLVAQQPGRPGPVASGLEAVRTALARYPEVLGLLPDLLDGVRQARAVRPGRLVEGLLVSAYGLVALALVKVDQRELAWLAADRGMTLALAVDDAQLAAAATVPLCQALRAGGRRHSAMEAARVVATAALGDPAAATPAARAVAGRAGVAVAAYRASGGVPARRGPGLRPGRRHASGRADRARRGADRPGRGPRPTRGTRPGRRGRPRTDRPGGPDPPRRRPPGQLIPDRGVPEPEVPLI
ncbi:helix-turn-helix domain-containing protein [Micromonospora yangpuensis]|uniref:helix-turn-helix domain-containing protein n=1 Tax=Micromonospora yangpuensis TaxID=683228 RepID=UPI000AEF343B|nr:helix-turn-helix domain-containing protein [Micromonospora yangpuensis]